ncbi:MAG: ThiF family adenylyltransferase [Methylococcaceae bacterium]|nr:ThiF family adenylyltransferase [Methylococcaceae bacterium]
MSIHVDAFYERAFSRNRGLISETEQEKLKNTRVAISGMGGMGGVHAATLARTGIGQFAIADFDEFEVHNINRQYGATMSTVGEDKAGVMENIIKDINPNADVRAINKAIGHDNIDAFLADVDVLVDALDVFATDARRLIFRRAHERGIPVISVGPIGFGAVLLIFSADGMDYDTFFGLEDGMEKNDMIVNFLAGIAGQGPHLKYMDIKGIDPATGAAPSLGLACQIGAGMAATEVLNLMLNKRKPKYVPWFSQFDTLAGTYKHHYRWWGANNPIQRLRVKRLKKMIPAFADK